MAKRLDPELLLWLFRFLFLKISSGSKPCFDSWLLIYLSAMFYPVFCLCFCFWWSIYLTFLLLYYTFWAFIISLVSLGWRSIKRSYGSFFFLFLILLFFIFPYTGCGILARFACIFALFVFGKCVLIEVRMVYIFLFCLRLALLCYSLILSYFF